MLNCIFARVISKNWESGIIEVVVLHNRGIRINPPPLDPDQPNFSIWAGGFLIHISNSPKLARGVFISYRSVLDLFLTVFPLENPILGVQKPNFFSPAAGSNSGNSPKLEGGF